VARLVPLLEALLERNAEELVLAHGRRPAFRIGRELHPVAKQELTADQIQALLAELSSAIGGGLGAPGPGRFDYRFPDGRAFVCEIASGSPGGLIATLRPHRAVQAQPSGPTIASAPAPAPVAAEMQTIDGLLRRMVELGSSDLHLSSGEGPMVRIDGEVARLPEGKPLPPDAVRRMLLGIMPQTNRDEYERSHDTDFAYDLEGVARFRVNVFTDRKGPGGVFRTIPSRVWTAEDLDLPRSVLDLCQLTKGLVLVTGPTGSGKSTTLAAMIDHVNRSRPEHVITIEDPIEFVHGNQKCLINQREVHSHTESFKRALRAALREDPDIVLVGELRDLETIAIALETAETGHLVFGTLHTTSACGTVDRIIDQFPADRQAQIRTMLSESLKGVISQNLLRRIGGGRVAALEVLVITSAIANLIREAKTFQIPSLMQTGKRHGMQLMNDGLVALVKQKLVDPDEAYRKSVDKTGLLAQLRAAGFHPTSVSET